MQTTESKLENVTLYHRGGSSDKVYQCSIEPAGERFVVNFAHGRRGSTLNTGTKTNVPVDYDSARRIFDQLVKEKKHHPRTPYTEGESGTPYQTPGAAERFTGILPQLLNPIDETEIERLLHDDNYCAQEKLNGRHLLVRKHDTQIEGINKKGLLIGLPETVLQAIAKLPGSFIPDGESIGGVYHVFDLLMLNNEDLCPFPYRQRLAALMNLLASAQHRFIKPVETSFTTRQKIVLWKRLKAGNREGIVFKRLDAPCIVGRPNSGGPQLKHKFYATASCVVAKINVQRSVEIRLLDKDGWQNCGNVTIPANHQIPTVGQVVEVRYLYAHKESNALYQPIYEGSRDDVDVSECVLSQIKYRPEDEN